jgi:hypothetical protein
MVLFLGSLVQFESIDLNKLIVIKESNKGFSFKLFKSAFLLVSREIRFICKVWAINMTVDQEQN